MKKLIGFTVILCSFFTGALIFVRIVGFSQPDSEPVRLLGLKSCEQPCVMGVTLGKTSYEDARRILAAYQAPDGYKVTVAERVTATNLPFLHVSWMYPDEIEPIIIDFYSFTEKVVIINFGSPSYPEFMPSLADLLQIYGIPQCAVHDGGSAGDYILMPIDNTIGKWEIEVEMNIIYGNRTTQPLGLNQPARWLVYNYAEVGLPENDPNCRSIHWHGIAHSDIRSSCPG